MLHSENWTNLSVVTQPLKIIRPKLSGVSKEEGNGVVTKKEREKVWGRSRVREGKIYFIFLVVETTYYYYHWIYVK